MKIDMDYKKGVLMVKIQGEIDHHTSMELRDALDKMIETKVIRLMTLDFGGVTFMDSSGIGVIVGRYKRLMALGGESRIINANKQVDKILEISGIKTIIRCEKEVREDE